MNMNVPQVGLVLVIGIAVLLIAVLLLLWHFTQPRRETPPLNRVGAFNLYKQSVERKDWQTASKILTQSREDARLHEMLRDWNREEAGRVPQ